MKVRWLLALLGMAALIAGCIALTTPLALNVVDHNGNEIACGTALNADADAAADADSFYRLEELLAPSKYGSTDYSSQCDSMLSGRRSWAIPVSILGALLAIIVVSLSGRITATRRRSE